MKSPGGEGTLIGIPPVSPRSLFLPPAASTQCLSSPIFQARVCCLLIINSPTSGPESQGFVELEPGCPTLSISLKGSGETFTLCSVSPRFKAPAVTALLPGLNVIELVGERGRGGREGGGAEEGPSLWHLARRQ